MRRIVGLVLRKQRKNYECGMCNLEMMFEGERKKRMELNEFVNVVVAEWERENVREKIEVEARNLRKEVDRLKGKVEGKGS